jgi:hypothetical protein
MRERVGGAGGTPTNANRRRAAATASVVGTLLLLAGCGGSSPSAAPGGTTSTSSGPPRVLKVPADHPTITAAVAAARRGDMVLISPGGYHESVEVNVSGIVIRGLDRNAVVVDGDFKKENGFFVGADEVAIENLTVRNFNSNGIFFTGSPGDAPTSTYDQQNGSPNNAGGNPSHSVDPGTVLKGYRASYITAYNNGLYGLYAFAAQGGQFDHSYASGHPDSGFYVGQCNPCDAVVTDVVGEHNAVGFEGTNASTNTYVVRSVWRANRVGVTFNSQTTEQLAPQGSATVAGNLVVDNSSADSPAQARGGFGLGVALGGSRNDVVVRNRITGNASAGVILTSLETFFPEGNRVEANVLGGNGTDLVYTLATGQTGARGNCFVGNTFTTSSPPDIEAALPCSPTAAGGPGPFTQQSAPPGLDYRKMAAPPPQPSMPDAATAPPQLATAQVPPVDVAAISVPAAPA